MDVNDPNAAQWVTAGAAVFGALGTIGAVGLTMLTLKRERKVRLVVTCRRAVASFTPGTSTRLISLQAVNDGVRPVTVRQAALGTSAENQVWATPSWSVSDTLPKVVMPGETVAVQWEENLLDDTRANEGFDNYLFGFFTDSLSGLHLDAYPGVKRKRFRRALVSPKAWRVESG